MNVSVKKLLCYFLDVLVITHGFHFIGAYITIGGLWIGILEYLLLLAVTIYCVRKVEKKPLSYIGLKRICLWDIPKGLLLGFFIKVLFRL